MFAHVVQQPVSDRTTMWSGIPNEFRMVAGPVLHDIRFADVEPFKPVERLDYASQTATNQFKPLSSLFTH
jgi:hypothetical protein